MKLLFDENLSYRLVSMLGDEYPGSRHVRDVDLRATDDERIWEYARSAQFVIVSKDTDFRERSYVHGAPPKVVWLSVGNAGTETIAELMRLERARLEHFGRDETTSLLPLSIGPKVV